jgi:hypothetical protein
LWDVRNGCSKTIVEQYCSKAEGCKKNIALKTLVGPVFQQNAENKFEKYLVESQTWLSLPPALQKSTLHTVLYIEKFTSCR